MAKFAVTARARSIVSVIARLFVSPCVSPDHPTNSQFMAGAAVTTTPVPASVQPFAGVTLPLPFVAVASQYCVCHCHVSVASFVNGRSHLIVRRGKNGKGRTVHVGKEFKHLLKEYLLWKVEQNELTPDSYLIRNARGERYTPTGLWKRWRKYAPNGHRLHDARHTNASLLYQATRDLRMVQQQLGHSRITTTTVYATVCPELIQDGMNQMERLAKSSLKPAPSAASSVATAAA